MLDDPTFRYRNKTFNLLPRTLRNRTEALDQIAERLTMIVTLGVKFALVSAVHAFGDTAYDLCDPNLSMRVANMTERDIRVTKDRPQYSACSL